MWFVRTGGAIGGELQLGQTEFKLCGATYSIPVLDKPIFFLLLFRLLIDHMVPTIMLITLVPGDLWATARPA